METKNNINYSIVFLEYDPHLVNQNKSFDSLISIINNSKGFNFELIHIKNVKGFVNAVNDGLTKSKGDFIIFVANDVIIDDKNWLSKFNVENSLMGWRFTPFYMTGEMRPDFACWGISRSTYNKLGLMDTDYQFGYGFDDDDYIYKAKKLGINIVDVNINLVHLESMTYNTIFNAEKDEMTKRNKDLFISKWNLI